ncbi:lysophospholipid acyltransferase family protein [Hymenobacter psychrophilus]|uniref:KDO2-lipid IV(A) lauroyltransferase n=1 Tax=Hymenobacter psychrophilus TaxID=651662 RepID=A0A1H3GZD9_9BACT|nr:lysophospholipid acyltransferase family protein [Hymenobacter psychrophilus]SDY08305.1 KDO2-lipid IV(A) lauroyltransferase [Hymenobacter psychrophilus]
MSQPVTSAAYPWYFRPLNWLLLGLSALPLEVLYGFARLLYWLMAYVLRYRRRVVLGNLRNSFPEKSEVEIEHIARGFYWHFAQVIVEILKLRTISAAELRKRAVIENPELLERLFAENRQVLVLGSHAGNWEWILSAGALVFPNRAGGVYKPLTNPFFEAFMLKLRSRQGAELVPMLSTLRNLVKQRGRGRALSLLSDQAAGPEDHPYWTDFLHQDTPFYTGADKLAAQLGCAAAYVGIRRVRRGYYRITLMALHDGQTTLPPEEHQLTEAFARLLERDIQASPPDYLWSHRRWKHKREARS